MLTFLRKLRRKNIDNARIRRVIFYALGEILLVVIGILIAVQINNWNNQRRLLYAEELALARLAENLASDTVRYNFLDEGLSKMISRCNSALQALEKTLTIQQRLDLIKTSNIDFYLIEANRTTYEEMLNTGRLYALADKDLRSKINGYYQYVDRWSKYIERENSQLRTVMTQSELNDYWILNQRLNDEQAINAAKFPWLKQANPAELKALEALLLRANENYRNHISTIRFLERISTELLMQLEGE